MGILGKIGKAIGKGLEELDKPSVRVESVHRDLKLENSENAAQQAGGFEVEFGPSDPVECALPGHIRDSRRIEGLAKELAFYKRRSTEYFALIQKMETQREEWKKLYQRDSQGHQQAQAVLQEHIVTLRTQVVGLITMMNAHRKEKGEQPIDLSKLVLDLHAFPVGIAEETAERNARDLASVAPQTDATEALRAIHVAVPVPAGLAPEETEPPKKS